MLVTLVRSYTLSYFLCTSTSYNYYVKIGINTMCSEYNIASSITVTYLCTVYKQLAVFQSPVQRIFKLKYVNKSLITIRNGLAT